MVAANAADNVTAEKLTQFHDFIAASTRGIIR
jgi:UDP-N-acetylglucosamine acyltransferase